MSDEKQYLSKASDPPPKPAKVLDWARGVGAKMVDLKFTDLLGTWQHVSLPLTALDEDAFEDGLGFDGSSIRGWKGIQESDMLLVPDPATAMLDPFTEVATLSLLCNVLDPLTREEYDRDPRLIAQRAEAYLVESGIADTVYFGPEAEFFVFDKVSYDLGPNQAHYEVDSSEGYWNSSQPGVSYTIREKHGYFPVAPHDSFQDLRTEMVLILESLGIACEYHHHEVATAGQCEIDMRFTTMTRMADQLMTYKYVVRNCANRAGKAATFMPKPIFGDNGSGMHCHQSLWKDGKTLMADDAGYAGLSELARGYVGGLLEHAPALLAFAAPTTNSYRRLVPGYEAPVEPRLLAAATARPASGFRSTRRRRRPSGSSSAARTRPRTPTSRFRPCSSPGSTGSRRAWIRAARPTSTSSTRATRGSHRCRARSPRHLTRSKPTTSSCSRAASSPTT